MNPDNKYTYICDYENGEISYAEFVDRMCSTELYEESEKVLKEMKESGKFDARDDKATAYNVFFDIHHDVYKNMYTKGRDILRINYIDNCQFSDDCCNFNVRYFLKHPVLTGGEGGLWKGECLSCPLLNKEYNITRKSYITTQPKRKIYKSMTTNLNCGVWRYKKCIGCNDLGYCIDKGGWCDERKEFKIGHCEKCNNTYS